MCTCVHLHARPYMLWHRLASAISTSVIVAAGVPVSLAFAVGVAPQISAGAAFSVEVVAADMFGNKGGPSWSGEVHVSLDSASAWQSQASLIGVRSALTINGTAAFAELRVPEAGEGCVVTALSGFLLDTSEP